MKTAALLNASNFWTFLTVTSSRLFRYFAFRAPSMARIVAGSAGFGPAGGALPCFLAGRMPPEAGFASLVVLRDVAFLPGDAGFVSSAFSLPGLAASSFDGDSASSIFLRRFQHRSPLWPIRHAHTPRRRSDPPAVAHVPPARNLTRRSTSRALHRDPSLRWNPPAGKSIGFQSLFRRDTTHPFRAARLDARGCKADRRLVCRKRCQAYIAIRASALNPSRNCT